MYRARVEAVDGLKVRAGGKWLTCIGNKVVRAGDMIWTDGRCVYGHDRESQTPLVIVNPEPKEAIPLSIETRQLVNRRWVYYLTPGIYDLRKRDVFLFTDNAIEYNSRMIMTNNLRKVVNGHLNGTRKAINIDGHGNIYELFATTFDENRRYDKDWGVQFNVSFSIEIRKNGVVVQKVTPKDIVNWCVSKISDKHKHPQGYLPNTYPLAFFVNNENDWWVYAEAHTDLYVDTNSNEYFVMAYYLLTNRKEQLLTSEVNKYVEFNKQDVKFSMNDGFYFKLDKLSPDSTNLDASNVNSLTIFSPQDTKVATIKQPPKLDVNFRLAAYQLRPAQFLVNIRGYDYSRNPENNGLYICEEEELSQILSATITNQALRPMKRYRYWWERIQTIE